MQEAAKMHTGGVDVWAVAGENEMVRDSLGVASWVPWAGARDGLESGSKGTGSGWTVARDGAEIGSRLRDRPRRGGRGLELCSRCVGLQYRVEARGREEMLGGPRYAHVKVG